MPIEMKWKQRKRQGQIYMKGKIPINVRVKTEILEYRKNKFKEITFFNKLWVIKEEIMTKVIYITFCLFKELYSLFYM